MKNFSRYTRFKPEMKVKYTYYYDSIGNQRLRQRYPDLTPGQIAGRVCAIFRIDSNLFRPVATLDPGVDLEGEGYRMTRSLERPGGQQSFLRMFSDRERYPGEAETSAALKRLVMAKLPVIGFFVGRGSRDCDNMGDHGYFTFSRNKAFRQALVNQGFDFVEIRLDEEVPTSVKMLVIADPREPLSADERTRLDAYIARGDNLLVLGEPRRQEVVNEIVEPLGARFMPGQLVQLYSDSTSSKNNFFRPDFILSRPTEECGALCYIFQAMLFRGDVVTMPGCAPLAFEVGKGFEVTPLLESLPKLGWNELETTDFIDDTVRLNPAAGEVERAYPTALALTRRINNKEQKIIIAGDADCFSNGEVAMQRASVPARNYSFIMGAFFWMSDGEAPVDVRRPPTLDTKVFVTPAGMTIHKVALMGVFPFLLLLSCLAIWLRRRGR
jgi:ABC-2 type transport system permease protein